MGSLVFNAAKSRFDFLSDYKERHIPKDAGFRWDPAAKVWHTGDVLVAEKLVRFADSTAKTAMGERAAEAQAKAAAAAIAKAAAIEASKATDADIQIPAPEGLSYLPFQRAGIAYALSRDDVLLGDEMGLGKTVQLLGVVNATPKASKVLIVCPAYLKLNWRRECERWLVRPMTIGIATSKGLPDTDVVIVNYELLTKLADDIRARTWDVVGFDEAHFLKNPKAARTKAALGYKSKDENISPIPARRRLFLTGTPILNRPVELWPILKATGVFTDYFKFAGRYCAGYNNGFCYDASGASNLGELQEILRERIMVRRLKKDVLTELPAKTRRVLEIDAAEVRKAGEAETKAQEQHEAKLKAMKAAAAAAKAAGDLAGWRQQVADLKAASGAAFTEISRLRHETALIKAPYVAEHVKAVLEEVSSVVVFAHHRDVAERIAAEFGEDAVVVMGGMSPEARQEAVDRFQRGEAKVFVGTLQGAGTGLTLTAAPHAVMAELDWTPGVLAQAEDRIHRIGQGLPVTVDYLVAERSIDAKLAQTVASKQVVAEAALDLLVEAAANDDQAAAGETEEAA
jgi:SWI/SNF-related matrix-associated actin-dependent regulator 1 of chromatin subfamily A